jgi:tripartite-type tricarboxylate transporter receptor subunit TctC
MHTSRHALSRRSLLSLAGAGAAACAFPAIAQAGYPNKPVTIVVPVATGGPTDSSARVIGNALSKVLGQSIVIDNRPGAGGTLGINRVMQSAPDGYTLLWGGTSGMVIAPSLYPNAKYSPEKSFAPIGLVTRDTLTLQGRADLAPANAKELVAYSKNHQIKMGTGGLGGLPHLASEAFLDLTGLDAIHIPYKGDGPATIDLLGGVIDSLFNNTAFVVPHIKAGKLKAYVTTGRERDKDLPEVPTVMELFGGDYEMYSWFGLFALAGTPADVLNTLTAALAKVSADPAMDAALAKGGLKPHPLAPAEAAKRVSADYREFAEIIKRANIKITGE